MTKDDYSSSDDRALVQAAQHGDMVAFEELVARHRDKLYARAYSMMRNEEEAVDLSQEAWVKGWQRLGQFQGESSFGTWMTRIVINLCLDQLRKQKRQRTESVEEMAEESGGVERQMPVVTVNPTAGLERSELRQRIDRALGQLSYDHRTVLVLHEFEELEYKEIARVMDCSIGTVMSRLFYARRKNGRLAGGLEKSGFTMMDYQDQLSLQAYLDGELPEAEARQMADRLERDPEAAALLAELRQTHQVLAGFQEEVQLPETREFYWSKIKREIERQEAETPDTPVAVPLIVRLRRFLVPAAGLALLLIGGLIATQNSEQNGPIETSLADPGAMIYHDYSAGATFVWLSYPADKEIGDDDDFGTFE